MRSSASLRIGIARDLDEPDRRRAGLQPDEVAGEGRQHFAHRFRQIIDRLAGVLAGGDPRPSGGFAFAHAVDDHQGPRLVPGRQECVGESEAQSRVSGAGSARSLSRELLCVGGPPELQENESALLSLKGR